MRKLFFNYLDKGLIVLFFALIVSVKILAAYYISLQVDLSYLEILYQLSNNRVGLSFKVLPYVLELIGLGICCALSIYGLMDMVLDSDNYKTRYEMYKANTFGVWLSFLIMFNLTIIISILTC